MGSSAVLLRGFLDRRGCVDRDGAVLMHKPDPDRRCACGKAIDRRNKKGACQVCHLREIARRGGSASAASQSALSEWCPVEYMPLYRELTGGGNATPDEAKAMTLQQIEVDERRRQRSASTGG